LKQLHRRFGDRITFVEVLVRQAHPGGSEPAYRTFEQKMADARAYQREEGIPWPVVVDDLEGTVHHTWGLLSDPAFLIDRDGRVSLFCAWTAPKVLGPAMAMLLAQEGRGVVGDGVRRVPEVGFVLADGWRAMERGAPGSVVDLAIAAPPLPPVLWLGSRRPAPLLLGLAGLAAVGVGVGVLALGLRDR
jgi:hypothetical protein